MEKTQNLIEKLFSEGDLEEVLTLISAVSKIGHVMLKEDIGPKLGDLIESSILFLTDLRGKQVALLMEKHGFTWDEAVALTASSWIELREALNNGRKSK